MPLPFGKPIPLTKYSTDYSFQKVKYVHTTNVNIMKTVRDWQPCNERLTHPAD